MIYMRPIYYLQWMELRKTLARQAAEYRRLYVECPKLIYRHGFAQNYLKGAFEASREAWYEVVKAMRQ